MASWTQLATFLEVVREQSFSKAANKLDISPAAVSKQISQLERDLNVTLLIRSTRKLQLTATGEAIYEKAKLTAECLQDITQYAQRQQHEPEGHLFVVSAVSVGLGILLPLMENFLKQYPKITIDYHFMDTFPDMTRQQFDIAVGFPIDVKNVDPNLIAVPYFKSRRILCASQGYIKKYSMPKTYEDLRNHYYISHTSRLHDTVLSECKKRRVNMKKVSSINLSQGLLDLVLLDMGIARIADFILKPHLQQGTIKELSGFDQEAMTQTYLLFQQQHYQPLALQVFKDYLLASIMDTN